MELELQESQLLARVLALRQAADELRYVRSFVPDLPNANTNLSHSWEKYDEK